jgi:tetratricopeptide (TPR) repeat protein
VHRGEPRFSARQKKILLVTLAVAAAAGAGYSIYRYYASAPERAEVSFQEGMKFMGPGKYDEAVTYFTAAIDTWDQHAQAHLSRGVARQILGQSDAALADFERAAALDASLAEAYTGRGNILRTRGDISTAIEEFTKSINIRPTVEAYYQRGQLQAQQGDHRKAIEDFDRAIAVDRKAPYVYRARAESRRALGERKF